jgi:hypothetical protein
VLYFILFFLRKTNGIDVALAGIDTDLLELLTQTALAAMQDSEKVRRWMIECFLRLFFLCLGCACHLRLHGI